MTQSVAENISPTAGSAGPATAASHPKLLHLGCGLTAPAEWVNVDGSFNAWLAQRPRLKSIVRTLRLVPNNRVDTAWPTNVTIADLRKSLPFPDNSFDAVYSSHVLEHLHRDEALRTLKEAYRVLKPNGICRSMVPDLGEIVREYITHSQLTPSSGPVVAQAEDPSRKMVGRLLMREEDNGRRGLLYGLYRNLTDFHPHKWMYDVPSLARLMEEAGFKECRPAKFLETRIPLLDKVEMADRAVDAAIVEGVKQ